MPHQGQMHSRKSGGSKHQSGAGGKQTNHPSGSISGPTLHQRTTGATSVHQSNMKMAHQGQHGKMSGGTAHPTSAGKKPGKGSITGHNKSSAPKGSGTY